MPLHRHDTGMSSKIEDLGTVPSRPNLYEHMVNRIMKIVRDGIGSGDNYQYYIGPGIASWAGVRHRLGGRYKTDAVMAVIDDLLAEGKLLEVWWHDGSRRIEPKHWLILPECIEQLPGIHRVRGKLELVPEHIIHLLSNDFGRKW